MSRGTVTGRERTYSADQRLVSTTTKGGRIIHANKVFADIAGYQREELEGEPHNIVRHPDMPKAAFKDLWDTLKQDRPWMGIVKNRCKNGDHYWVSAYVTPVYENGVVVGYQSVRVKPDSEVRNRAEKLYQCIQSGARIPASLGLGKPKLGMVGRLLLGYLVCLLPVLAATWPVAGDNMLRPLLGAGASVAIALVLAQLFTAPYRKAAEKARNIFDNPIARRVYTGRQDELGQLELTIAALQAEIRTILTRVGGSAEQVDDVASEASAVVEQTDRAVQTQRTELQSVSSAMQQMSTTVEEVARNTASTADAAQDADNQVVAGRSVVDETVTAIEHLAQQVKQASSVISQLQADSESIGSVIDVIRGIADQTNLLALNAAIEAARAGEQGRGFAVVADEVRALASQTQESTEQIQTIIGSLQASTAEAVAVMDAGQEQAQASVKQAGIAGEALESIRNAVVTIKDMSLQIATASEEQSAVAEEINRNVTSISQVANETAEASQHTARSTEMLIKQVHGLRTLVDQFER